MEWSGEEGGCFCDLAIQSGRGSMRYYDKREPLLNPSSYGETTCPSVGERDCVRE